MRSADATRGRSRDAAAGTTAAVPISPFETLAATYDQDFTQTSIGKLMRRAVWRHLDRSFEAGERVLELGCGTGEDAVHLARRKVRVLATDPAAKMVKAARAKVARAGLEELVDVKRLAAEDVGTLGPKQRFDGAFSSFGALNCVEDLGALAASLTPRIQVRGRVILCLMGPVCLWEWGWFLARREPATAFRRLKRGGTEWRSLRIFYPSIDDVRKAFSAGFTCERVVAIGALVPPSYAESWASRSPRLLRLVNALERGLESVPPLPWIADHYLVELVRR